MVEQRVHHARHPEAQRDPLGLDRAQALLGIELVMEVNGATPQQRRHHMHPRGVGDRRRGQVADLPRELVLGESRQRHARQHAVRVHHALGPPGRSAGVDQPADVALDRVALQRRRVGALCKSHQILCHW